MKDVFSLTGNFFFSYNRKKNNETNVKGRKGKFSCYWYYELLLGLSRVESIHQKRYECDIHMEAKALKYRLVGAHMSMLKALKIQ